jgi:hypothetical protein
MTPISTDMIREFGLTTALAISFRTFLPTNHAFMAPEQQRISDTCGPHNTQISNVDRITVCMPKKNSLSAGDPSSFNKAR